MFRRLIMTIFRLYMKYLLSSYTKQTWAVYMGQAGGKVDTRSPICPKGWAVCVTWVVHAVTELCLRLLQLNLWQVSYCVCVCCVITLKYKIYNVQ